MKKLIFMAIILMGVQVCFAATINVPGDYSTVHGAVYYASDGDTIFVEPGIYEGSISFGSKNIVLKSTQGREVTFLEPQGEGSEVLWFWGPNSSLVEGFTIRGAKGSVGVYCRDASPTIQNCDISYNESYWNDGAGFYIRNSGIKIYNNIIHHNDGSITGGGIACHGAQQGVEIVGNIIYANRAPHGSGIGCPAIEWGDPYSYVENVYIADNLIFGNIEEPKSTPPANDTIPHSNPTGYMAAGIYIHGYDCQIVNNTIVDNPRGIMILKGNGIVIENNIVAFNDKDGLGAGAATLNCNDVYGNAYGNNPGTNGFSLDPMFCLADYGEFGLTEGSPCLPANNGCGVLIGAVGQVECIPRAVISVDRSGSMAISGPLGISRFDQAKELAVDELMRLLAPNDQDYPEIVETAIMYFNADGIVLHHDFSTDSTSLKEAILSIPTPRHDTPLAAAMCQSLCSMMDQGQGIKYMVTMTDGLENESQNFEICNLCRHCNQYFSSGWNYDCDPDEDPSSCTDWQLCLAETLESKGTHIVHYFGQTLEPQTKAGVGEGLEDMLFLEAAAENSSGSFHYHSDLATVCGDANYDGSVNVSDAVYIVNYVFIGGDEPVDYLASDSNCDGTVNISDAVYIINYIFISGPTPCANCQ